jgi:carboxypeptidase Q
MTVRKILPLILAALTISVASTTSQSFSTQDPVIHALWEEGTERSQVETLAQVLIDSIGPRLTGTPEKQAGHDWLVRTYRTWGVAWESQQYGTWKGWRRGATHVDLVQPRTQTLRATLVGWSPGTGHSIEGAAVSLPRTAEIDDLAAFERWRSQVRGSFVLVDAPELSCRPADQWREFSDESTYRRFVERRRKAELEWQQRRSALSMPTADLQDWLADLGAAGVFTSRWPGGYDVHRIVGDRRRRLPVVALSCEDYSLLHRLADRAQGPRVRVDARSEDIGTAPALNTIATLPGIQRPQEYVVLSAHFDSWDGATGATDNGTGTIVMLEAMRLLRAAYPNPKRTIIAGHWGGEEQGLNGSRAFVADHPDIVLGVQALLNQDNGTGRIERINMQGLLHAGSHFARWLSGIPAELSDSVQLIMPGTPSGGGTDHASFVCAGAPAFPLRSEPWDYAQYTRHTNLDTFDKVVVDNVRHNAILVAMLAYLASDDPNFLDRERRIMPMDPTTGQPIPWPTCREPMRRWEDFAW